MYKSKLQQLCHRHEWSLPDYSHSKEGSDNRPSFSASVSVNGLTFHSLLPWSTAKQACNEAAKCAFLHLAPPDAPVPESSPRSLSFGSFSVNANLDSPMAIEEKLQPIKETLQDNQINGTTSSSGDDRRLVVVNDMRYLYKNQLQNYAQKRNLSLPIYSCRREGPPHDSRFKSKVTIDGQTFESLDFSRTLKEAEHLAAKFALISLSSDKVLETDSGFYKNFLQELAQKEGLGLPVYKTSGPSPMQTFLSVVEVGDENFSGQEARNKKLAEMSAAEVAYTCLKMRSFGINANLDSPKAIEGTLQPIKETLQDNQINETTSSSGDDRRLVDMGHMFKNQLQNLAQKRNLTMPMYFCECEGPPHASRFKSKVTVDGQTFECSEFFHTRKEAEHAAAKVALLSLSPDGVEEDDSGVYKNLLQELAHKKDLVLPVYKAFCLSPTQAYVATVEIGGEIFQGQEAKNKKQAEMSAAKVAYTSLRNVKSSHSPKFPSYECQVVVASPSSIVAVDLQENVRPKSPFRSSSLVSEEQSNDNDSNTDSMGKRKSGSSSNTFYAPSGNLFLSDSSPEDGLYSPSEPSGNARDLVDSKLDDPAASLFEGGPYSPSELSGNARDLVDSKFDDPAVKRSLPSKRVTVQPYMPNMTFLSGVFVLPISDDKWVALCSAPNGKNI